MLHFRFPLENWIQRFLRDGGAAAFVPITDESVSGDLTLRLRFQDQYSAPIEIGNTADGFEECFAMAKRKITEIFS